MSLSVVHRLTFSEETAQIAYKVVRHFAPKTFESPINHGEYLYRVGDEVVDHCRLTLADGEGVPYKSGFHAYKSRKDAMRMRDVGEYVLKVRLRELTAEGVDYHYPEVGSRLLLSVVVGRRMKILGVSAKAKRR